MSTILVMRRAIRLVEPQFRRRYIFIGALGVLAAGLDMAAILLLVPLLAFLGQPNPEEGRIVDFIQRVTGDYSNQNIVLILAGVAAVLFILKSIVSVTLIWLQAGVLNEAAATLSRRLLIAYARAPWLKQQDSTTGSLVRTTNESVIGSVVAIGGAIFGLIADGAVFLAVSAAVLWISPVLAVAAMLYLVGASILYLALVRRKVQQRGQVLQIEYERMNGSLISLVGGIKELVVRGTASTYVDRHSAAFQSVMSAMRVINVASFSTRYLLESLMITGVALVILASVALGTIGSALVSVGVLLAAGMRALPALSSIMIWINVIRSNGPAVGVVEDELARLEASSAEDNASALIKRAEPEARRRPSGAFSFTSVSFRYPDRPDDALFGITVEVPARTTLGIVGGSGAGKSTFVDILLGLLEPMSGAVSVDGKPLGDQLTSWRAALGLVPQDVFLFDDTLEANITLGASVTGGPDDALEAAIRLAQLGDVVEGLPDGIATQVGERGSRLSGGQRQRLGLARALYTQPSVLILDEATSALDNETEHRITSALRSLHGEMTMVIIAHRLSTVGTCDRILFLDGGQVAGFGTFDELRAENDRFARLVELGSLGGVI